MNKNSADNVTKYQKLFSPISRGMERQEIMDNLEDVYR